MDGSLLLANQSLNYQSQSLVHIASSESELFPVVLRLHQSCPLSLVLFIAIMDRISMCVEVAKGIRFGVLRNPSLPFADYMILLTLLNSDIQLEWAQFLAKYETTRIKIKTSEGALTLGNHSMPNHVCPLKSGFYG